MELINEIKMYISELLLGIIIKIVPDNNEGLELIIAIRNYLIKNMIKKDTQQLNMREFGFKNFPTDEKCKINVKENMLEKAIGLAVKYHAGQVDKANIPYILHVLTVMLSLDSEEEKIVATLHDIVEDTEMTLEKLQEEGFSNTIVEAVEAMTREKDEKYEAYIDRLSQNILAIKVKLADIKHNLDVTRVPSTVETNLKLHINAYHKLKAILQKTHK